MIRLKIRILYCPACQKVKRHTKWILQSKHRMRKLTRYGLKNYFCPSCNTLRQKLFLLKAQISSATI